MTLRQFRRAEGHGDQMIARGTLNLFPGELFVGLQVLRQCGQENLNSLIILWYSFSIIVRAHGCFGNICEVLPQNGSKVSQKMPDPFSPRISHYLIDRTYSHSMNEPRHAAK
jgi:hypothetical protein